MFTEKSRQESYDPENPTEGAEKSKLRCGLCELEFENEEEMKKHKTSDEHKEKVASARASNSSSKGFCHICDVALDISFLHHQRQTFHKKRKIQVLKGCGWCKVTSFKNFTEVLKHRSTEKHTKNQSLFDRKEREGDRKSRRDSGSRPARKERERLKVELPPELAKFDPKAVVGQACVIAVTGWFCKLCNKFYNNETAAKETHCMSEIHFNNYKKFMYTKLRAKAEAERDAKEKAEKEEEERKKKEAEEAAAAATEKGEGGEGAEGKDPATTNGTTTTTATTEPSAEATEGQGQNPATGDAEEEEEMEVAGEEEEGLEEEGGEAGEEGEEEVYEEGGDDGMWLGGDEGMWAGAEEGGMAEEEEEELAPEDEEEQGGEAAEEGKLEGAEDVSESAEGNAAGNPQEDEPMGKEEPMEGEEEEVEVKKLTRAAISGSPGRGRGRGAGANRARRGRARVTK